MGGSLPDDFEGVTISTFHLLLSLNSPLLTSVKNIEPPPSTQRDIIAETCFRDAWDTDFAFKFWNTLPFGIFSREKVMSDQLKEETARRREWDRECSHALKPWVNSRK
jgi:hypothetical protein